MRYLSIYTSTLRIKNILNFLSLILLIAGLFFYSKASAMSSEWAWMNSDFNAKTLGSSCFAMNLSRDQLPCNPAFMALSIEPEFKLQGFFANNIKNLRDIEDLTEGRGSKGALMKVIADDSNARIESQIELGYQTSTWGLSLVPLRLNYSSWIRNQSLPVVDVRALKESSLRMQLASYMNEDIYFGTQFRLVKREFVFSTFSLADLAAEGGEVYLEPKDQEVLYVEPGFLIEPEGAFWHPRISASLLNLGFFDKDYAYFDNEPVLNLGASLTPILAEQVGWEVGFNYQLLGQNSDLEHNTRLATSIRISHVLINLSGNEDSRSLGMQLDIGQSRWSLSVEDIENTSALNLQSAIDF